MHIKIQTTVREIRELGRLAEFCELFHYSPTAVTDDSPVVMTLEQARKINLPLPFDAPDITPPVRKRKAKGS